MEKEELREELLKQVGGLGTEVGAGLALDKATAPLLVAPFPGSRILYGGINFAGGAASNYAAQRIRGEEDTNWGEVISSGLLGIIPFTSLRFGKRATQIAGEAGSVKRAIVGGAGMGASDRFIQSGLNEGELPSPTDVAVGTVAGGALGGTFQKSFDEFGKILDNYRGQGIPTEQIPQAITQDPKASRHLSLLRNDILDAYAKGDSQLVAKKVFEFRKAHGAEELKNYDSYEQYAQRKIDLQGKLNDNIDGIDPSDAYERDLTKFYEKENVQFPVRVLEDVPQDIRATMAWESGLVDGVFDFDRWLSKSLYGKRFRSRTTVAKMQAAYGTDVNFEKYRDNVLLPQFEKEWGPILDKLKIKRSSLQAHHIFAIRASAGLYDGLQFGSKEWADVTNALLKKYIRPGDMPKNLMPLVGSTSDKNTPHYITHRYIDELVGPTGETFFKKEVRDKMKKNHKFRIKKTEEFAEIMKTAEGVAVQSQKVWDKIYGPGQVIPEELVEELSSLPMTVNPKYRTDVELERLVKQVFSQIKEFPFPESMSRKEFIQNWLPQFEGKGFDALRRMFEADLDLTPEQAMQTPLGYRLQKYLQTHKIKVRNPIKKRFVKRKKK